MFLRKIKGKKRSYLAIVEGYREDGKVKQRLIANLGTMDDLNTRQLLALGRGLIAECGKVAITDATDITEQMRKNWGAVAILNRLWEQFHMSEFFDTALAKRKLQFDLESALKLMLVDRLCTPRSKLSSYDNQSYYTGLNPVSLQHLYRALDELAYYQEPLKQHIYQKQLQSSGQVEVLYFDVTTLYFESVRDDALKAFGYSKDCKFSEVQVVLSLVIDAEGRPVGYDLFPGNCYEGHTVVPNLKRLRELYNIKRVIIVADRGLSSKPILAEVTKAGFEYVMGARLRSACSAIKVQALDPTGYITIRDTDHLLQYKVVPQTPVTATLCWYEHLVCVYSSQRAQKDKKDRDRLVAKAQKIVTGTQSFPKRGAKKYLKIEEECSGIDEDKIEQEARWDGYYAIATNLLNAKSEDIIAAYHQLWRIEESFRTLKHHFEARPIFHWTPSRIHGHIMLNFLALTFENFLLRALSAHQQQASHQSLRTAISTLELSELNVSNKRLIIYAKISPFQQQVLHACNIPMPVNHFIM